MLSNIYLPAACLHMCPAYVRMYVRPWVTSCFVEVLLRRDRRRRRRPSAPASAVAHWLPDGFRTNIIFNSATITVHKLSPIMSQKTPSATRHTCRVTCAAFVQRASSNKPRTRSCLFLRTTRRTTEHCFAQRLPEPHTHTRTVYRAPRSACQVAVSCASARVPYATRRRGAAPLLVCFLLYCTIYCHTITF